MMNKTRLSIKLKSLLSIKLESLQTNIDAVETVLIDIISGLVPWFAPLLPAYMAYTNMTNVLGFDKWLALAGALVIEFLGLATVHTAVQFANYNDTARKMDIKKQGQAPVYWAVGMGLVYLLIVLSVNVILDGGTEPVTHTVTKALLSLISVPAAITIAIRSQHKRRLHGVAETKIKQPRKQPMQPVASQGKQPTGKMSATRRAVLEVAQSNPGATSRAIAEKLDESYNISITRQSVDKHRKALNGSVTA